MRGYSLRPIRFFMRVYDVNKRYDTGVYQIGEKVNTFILSSLKGVPSTKTAMDHGAFTESKLTYDVDGHIIEMTMIINNYYVRRN